jgi:hypothetical protein
MYHQKPETGAPLEVSVQILNFEAGLYRMSFASQRGPTSAGLPWAKLEAPPGAKPGQSAIVVQGENGWFSRTGDSALVQVRGERAPLLLTIYQVSGRDASPEFTVQRLDVQPAAALQNTSAIAVTPAAQSLKVPPRTAASPGPQTATIAAGLVAGLAHAEGRDVAIGADGWIGVPTGRAPLEGFALTLAGPPGVGVEYSATLGPDWSTPWARDGEFCGSRGLALPILGLTARLVGPNAEQLDLRYLVRFLGGQEVGPMPAGDLCAAPDGAPIEAFRFVIAPANHHTETMQTVPEVAAVRTVARVAKKTRAPLQAGKTQDSPGSSRI